MAGESRTKGRVEGYGGDLCPAVGQFRLKKKNCLLKISPKRKKNTVDSIHVRYPHYKVKVISTIIQETSYKYGQKMDQHTSCSRRRRVKGNSLSDHGPWLDRRVVFHARLKECQHDDAPPLEGLSLTGTDFHHLDPWP